MKKYLPLRVFSIHFGFGWWWGKHFIFLSPFAIVPMFWHFQACTYPGGLAIGHGDIYSWDKERQREAAYDKQKSEA